MITYFEKLTTIHLLLILFRYPASLSSIDKKNIFFFDISKLAKKASKENIALQILEKTLEAMTENDRKGK